MIRFAIVLALLPRAALAHDPHDYAPDVIRWCAEHGDKSRSRVFPTENQLHCMDLMTSAANEAKQVQTELEALNSPSMNRLIDLCHSENNGPRKNWLTLNICLIERRQNGVGWSIVQDFKLRLTNELSNIQVALADSALEKCATKASVEKITACLQDEWAQLCDKTLAGTDACKTE